MVQIGELAWRTKFDGRELSRGLMSTRQQMSAAKKITEESRTPLDRYKIGLQNLAAMSERYTHVAEKQAALSERLRKQYAEEEAAVRKLSGATRDAANKQAGLARQAMFSGIDSQQASGRTALQARLQQFKSDRRQRMQQYSPYDDSFRGVGGGFAGSGGGGGDSGGGGMGTGFMFGARAVVGGFAAAKVVQSAAAMRDFASESTRVYVSLEKTQAAFDVFTGSSAKTQVLIGDMKQLSALSGVTFSTMSEGAATMMSYGLATESTTEKLKQMATISRGDSERFKAMALAFGQVQAAGRLMGQEVLQLINAGFNPLAEISRTTGRSMGDLKKDMENGLITVDMVSNAFKSATSEGGRYNGMLEKIGQTTAGAQAKSSAAWEQAKADIGSALAPLTQFQAMVSTAFAQGISDFAAPFASATAITEGAQPSAQEAAKKQRADALAAERARAELVMKTERERAEAMKQSGLASLSDMTGSALAGVVDGDQASQFSRAISLMDEASKKQATIDFAQYRSIENVLSYLDEEVRLELEKLQIIEKQAKARDKFAGIQETGKALAEQFADPTEKLRKDLVDLQVMLQAGAIDKSTFGKAQDDVLNQSVQGRPAMQLAPSLRAGSQEAYAAMVSAGNSAQERALKEQQKQIVLQQEANNIARDVKTALEELKEVMPGKGN